jgi:arginyl-tRNA synthetase
VLAQWGGDVATLASVDLSILTSSRETILMQKLSEFPDIVHSAAHDLAPHMMANYLKECASELHGYYNDTKFLVDELATKLARLALITATKHVLKNGLDLLGVSAPTSM